MAAQNSSRGAPGSYYDLLGVTENATEDQICSAFRQKARIIHSDRFEIVSILTKKSSASSSSSASAASASSSSLVIGVFCTKKHEFDAMKAVLDAQVVDPARGGKITPSSNTTHLICSQYHFSTYEIILCSIGIEMGPVECSIGLVLMMKRFPSINAVIMPGICGGVRLGAVIVATRCKALDLGRVVWDSQTYKYEDDHGENSYQMSNPFFSTWPSEANGKTFQELLSCCVPIGISPSDRVDVEHGSMLAVTKVRDDSFLLLREHAKSRMETTGIEMESWAFFKTLELLYPHVQCLGVVKGTSDVGFECFSASNRAWSIRNTKEMQRVQSDFEDPKGKPFDNTVARKSYRKIAAYNAAAVCWYFLQKWINIKQDESR